MFIPTGPLFYFVSTGVETKMFTLRVMIEGFDVNGELTTPGYRAEYIQNLSTDWDVAEEKAKRFSAAEGLEYKVLLGDKSLYDIERLKSGEREAIIAAATEKREAAALAEAKEKSDAIVRFFKNHPEKLDTPQFGKFNKRGFTFEQIAKFDDSYIRFLVEDMVAPEDGLWRSPAQFQANWVRDNIAVVTRSESEHVGEIKDKVGCIVTCINKTGFANDYGWVDRYTCRDENDNIFLVDYTGSKWGMKVGSEYHLSGTIKDHSEYRGVKQTKLTRAKVIIRADYESSVAEQAAKEAKSPKAPSSTAPKAGTKMDRARAIFAEHRLTESRGFILDKFMAELDMKPAGAATYYQKCKKEERDNEL